MLRILIIRLSALGDVAMSLPVIYPLVRSNPDKEFYFLLAAADKSKQAMERTLEEFRGFTSCLENATEKGVIYGTGAWNIGDLKDSEVLNQAFEMGKFI